MTRLRSNDWLLLTGLVFFVMGATLLLKAIDDASDSALLAGIVLVAGAVIAFGAAALRLWRRVDWDRVESEQRLRESGPLGRRWLRLRQMLAGDARPRDRRNE